MMRSRIVSNDVVKAQILRECANGVSGTRIVHQANSNTMKVISYLLMIDEGLIEVKSVGHRIIHITTPKGLDQIERFERFHVETDKSTCKT
jgi:predicted transcriptional regulator